MTIVLNYILKHIKKKENISADLSKKKSCNLEKVFYKGRVFIVNNTQEFEKALTNFCCGI